MKIPIYIKQPLTQVLLYIILYELILLGLKSNNLIHLNTSIGITSRYLFYLFLFFSFILSVVLFFRKEKLFHLIALMTLYLITSILFFGFKSKLIIIILSISIFSSLISYFIFNLKKSI